MKNAKGIFGIPSNEEKARLHVGELEKLRKHLNTEISLIVAGADCQEEICGRLLCITPFQHIGIYSKLLSPTRIKYDAKILQPFIGISSGIFSIENRKGELIYLNPNIKYFKKCYDERCEEDIIFLDNQSLSKFGMGFSKRYEK